MTEAPKATATQKSGYGLVRDSQGRPRIDDPTTLHPGIVSMLTMQEKIDFDLWPGMLIQDAEGIKRATLVSRTNARIVLTIVDPIVHAGNIYVDGCELRVKPRFNAPAGETVVVGLIDTGE